MSRPADDNPREQIQEGRPVPRPASARPEEDEGLRRRAPVDDDDDAPRRRPLRGDEETDRYSGFVPYRNACALIGYYMGFLGIIATLGGFAYILFRLRQDPLAGITDAGHLTFIYWGVMFGAGGLCAVIAITLGAIGLAKTEKRKGAAHAVLAIVLGSLEIIGLILLLVFQLVELKT